MYSPCGPNHARPHVAMAINRPLGRREPWVRVAGPKSFKAAENG